MRTCVILFRECCGRVVKGDKRGYKKQNRKGKGKRKQCSIFTHESLVYVYVHMESMGECRNKKSGKCISKTEISITIEGTSIR